MTVSIIKKPVAANNFSHGRGGHKPDVITIHISEGSAQSGLNWFNDPHAHVSSHYLIAKDGTIYGLVAESDTAQVNGIVDRPSAQIVKERLPLNPNHYTIGIEHEGHNPDAMTPAQFAASAALIADIAKRNGIPLDSTHVFGHHEIRFSKPCPGVGMTPQIPGLIAAAQALIDEGKV